MRLTAILLFVIILTQDFIDLELSVSLGFWDANAPIADVAALFLLPLVLKKYWQDPIPLPGIAGYGLMLIAALLSTVNALDPVASLHHMIRKPGFMYVAYGLGVAWTVARISSRKSVWNSLLVWLTCTAIISLSTSVARIATGNALWFAAISGLTPNHKTLAVGMAGILPLIFGWRGRHWKPVSILVLAAIVLSTSKTAAIIAAFSIGWFLPRDRPIMTRTRWAIPMLSLAIALAIISPVLIGSKTMLDAARSRHSLNERAWEMFTSHPLIGSGTGMNIHYELVTFPHYRVNGVDAHGIIQKVGSETGVLGLIGYSGFAWATVVGFRRRWSGDADGVEFGAMGTWVALNLGLTLSTEVFSPTWWTPLAIAWGMAHHKEPPCAS